MSDVNNTRTTRRKKRRTITIELLDVIRNQVYMGFTNQEIANNNTISISCARNLANKITQGQSNAEIVNKKGRKHLPNTDKKYKLTAIVQADNSLTQAGMAQLMASQGVAICQTYISKLLKGLQITRKRLSLVPVERNSPRIMNERRSYAAEVEIITSERLIYLDETGFNLHTTANYGYSPVNIKAFTNVKANRGINQSLMCAISIEGIIASEIIDGAYNGDTFMQFIRIKLIPYFIEHQNSVLIMDNCRFHHKQDVLQLLRESSILYKFLPPYSPQLNPIEEFFGALKARYKAIRPKPRTVNAVKNTVNEILCGWNSNFYGYYEKMRRMLLIALANQPFL